MENAAGRGMQTFDHGHHLWATAWFLMGDVERVVGWIDSLDGIIDSPAAIMWKYRDGTGFGMCEYAHASDMVIPSKYYANDEWIEITGTSGVIVINSCTGDIVEGPGLSFFNGDCWKHYDSAKTDWAEGFIGATHNFIESIKGKSKPLLSGDEGREILRLNLAIAKSSRVRREVYLDEMDSNFPWLFSRKKISREKKKKSYRKSFMDILGFGSRDSEYAGRAVSVTEGLIERFDVEKAKNWETVIGLHLTADGHCPETLFSLHIEAEKAVLEKGRLPEKPELVIKSPAGTWAAILLGKKRIETAFLQGKLKLNGKAELGLKLREVFEL